MRDDDAPNDEQKYFHKELIGELQAVEAEVAFATTIARRPSSPRPPFRCAPPPPPPPPSRPQHLPPPTRPTTRSPPDEIIYLSADQGGSRDENPTEGFVSETQERAGSASTSTRQRFRGRGGSRSATEGAISGSGGNRRPSSMSGKPQSGAAVGKRVVVTAATRDGLFVNSRQRRIVGGAGHGSGSFSATGVTRASLGGGQGGKTAPRRRRRHPAGSGGGGALDRVRNLDAQNNAATTAERKARKRRAGGVKTAPAATPAVTATAVSRSSPRLGTREARARRISEPPQRFVVRRSAVPSPSRGSGFFAPTAASAGKVRGVRGAGKPEAAGRGVTAGRDARSRGRGAVSPFFVR